MAYIGNTAEQQAFTPAIDYFSGNGSTVAFTLSRPVASVAQVQAVIENVPQNPGDAYTVSGNTITFTSAPPSGTSNIYVYYTSPITTVATLSQDPVVTGSMTFGSTGARIRGDFSNATAANRVSFQSSTTNGNTVLQTIPNGTATQTNFLLYSDSAQTNFAALNILQNASETSFRSIQGGSGSYVPLTMYTGGSERMRIDTSGNVGIGTSSPQARLHQSSTNDGVQAIFTGAQTGTTQTILLRSQYQTNNGTAGFANIGWFDNGSQGGGLTFGTTSNGSGTTGTPTERMRITSTGAISVGSSGTATGTAGQVLTSGGSGSAPTWSDVSPPTTFGAIGTYVAAFGADNTGYATGATIAGSSLTYRNAGSAGGFSFANNGGSFETMYHQASGTYTSLSLSGTWRCMTGSGGGAPGSGWRVLHLWVRIS